MFQKAAAHRPADADVRTVLGVLHHISGDYDDAVAAFEAAVAIRPDDPFLVSLVIN
jgi:peroxin-5